MSILFTKEVYEGTASYTPTPLGYMLFVAILLVLLGVAAFFAAAGKKKRERKSESKGTGAGVRQLAFSAMAIALATVMSMLKLIELPMGGSLTLCSMLFITLIGYWFGLRAGLLTAVAYGILQLIMEPYIITPFQLLVDYVFAFGALGLSGIFSNLKGGLFLGYWAGVCARFVFAFFSGMIFFGAYAAEYGMSAPVYSALYNGSYLFTEAIVTTLILLIPSVRKALIRMKSMTQPE